MTDICRLRMNCVIRLLSEDDKWLSFNNYRKVFRLSVYADLECILEKTETEENHMYQHHRIFNIEYYVHCSYDDSLLIGCYVLCFYRDKDCVVWFTEQLRNLAHSVKPILSANVPMIRFRL